jgi:hypothetical protein
LQGVLLGVTVVAAVIAGAGDADAHNAWNGGYRKWPWKAEAALRSITTLPNTWPHSAQTNQLAIDIDMYYETVYSIAPTTGSFVQFVDRFCLGFTLTVQDKDLSYVVYAHLDPAMTPPSGAYVAGMAIAKSGNSGTEDGTSCSTGAHLHYARYSAQPAFTMSDRNIQLTLEPSSAHGGVFDTLIGSCTYYPPPCGGYTSDNAGIGYNSAGVTEFSMVTGYLALGQYGWGVTAQLGSSLSPCGVNTWWRYTCNPASWANGSVQTYKGPGEKPRAIMKGLNLSAFGVDSGNLKAYTQTYSGNQWVYWIGYPTSNRYHTPPYASDIRLQDFQFGRIVFDMSPCREDMYQYDVYITSYFYCD